MFGVDKTTKNHETLKYRTSAKEKDSIPRSGIPERILSVENP